MFINYLARRFAQALADTPQFQQLLTKENTIMEGQSKLDSIVADLKQSFNTAIGGLKAQIAAGTPSNELDLTELEAFQTTVDSEAQADAAPAKTDGGAA